MAVLSLKSSTSQRMSIADKQIVPLHLRIRQMSWKKVSTLSMMPETLNTNLQEWVEACRLPENRDDFTARPVHIRSKEGCRLDYLGRLLM